MELGKTGILFATGMISSKISSTLLGQLYGERCTEDCFLRAADHYIINISTMKSDRLASVTANICTP